MTRIAVAGAGIAGLSIALALSRAGVSTDVFDTATVLSEAGAGVQLSPNATRVLRRFGLLDRLDAVAVRPEAVCIRSARDGAVLANLPLGPTAEARYGAPFLVLHRADLQAVLLAAVSEHQDITLTLGARLSEVVPAEAGVSVGVATPNDEAVRTYDGIVGADGLRSALRSIVAPGDPPPAFSGRIAFRATMPAGDVPAFARLPRSNLWLGPGAHLVHYPVRGGSLVNVVAIVDGRLGEAGEGWAAAGDPARLRTHFAGWAADARALLAAAPRWGVWPLFDRPPLRDWVRGPIMLAGDAAHPMLPFLAQGAGQAVEDAGALEDALRHTPDVAAAARAYALSRRSKADRVQRESRRQGIIYHLRGPAALARDTAFRLMGERRMLARYDWLYGA